MAGVLSAETLDNDLDVNGTSFRQAAAAVGYVSESTQVSKMCTRTASLDSLLITSLSETDRQHTCTFAYAAAKTAAGPDPPHPS